MPTQQKDRINLNTASRRELEGIPNLGRECADKIVEERKRRGGFKSMNELDQIGGFGEEAVRNLKANATV